MNKLLFLAVVLANVKITYGNPSSYAVDGISKPLLEGASAVIRVEEQLFDITSAAKARLSYKVAITILNKSGERYTHLVEGYDQFSSISNISASLYDATGKLIRAYKKADIGDRSMISNFSIYEDNRIKYLTFAHASYPYTIEYSYVKDFKGFLTVPSWRPANTFGLAVERSTYTLQCPESYSFKKHTSHGLQVDSSMTGGKKRYKWTCKDLPAIVYEPYSVGIDNLVPWVSASPHDFEYDGTRGSVADWNQLGKWLHTLSEGGTRLGEETKAEVMNLTKGAATDREKIQILYNYLQQQTRYVSVQLGIGGFKPIGADKVAQVKYGDCKALSNFMKALLKEAGISSNLVMIGSGLPSLNASYASFGQANHMILCIPNARDTTFLECTSHHYPTGYIGHSNAGRAVLMVGDGGGTLVGTPTYHAKDNYLERNAQVTFGHDLVADIDINTVYGHAQFESVLDVLLDEPSEQRKYILENLGIAGMELTNYSYLQADKDKPELTEKIKVRSKQLLSKGGDRVFLTANLLNRRESVPATVADRKTHFAVSFAYSDVDEITYALPEGYAVEHLPKDTELESEFGTYTATYTIENQSIVYRRVQQMNSKRYPPEKYQGFVDFFKQVYQADRQKIVLAKVI